MFFFVAKKCLLWVGGKMCVRENVRSPGLTLYFIPAGFFELIIRAPYWHDCCGKRSHYFFCFFCALLF